MCFSRCHAFVIAIRCIKLFSSALEYPKVDNQTHWNVRIRASKANIRQYSMPFPKFWQCAWCFFSHRWCATDATVISNQQNQEQTRHFREIKNDDTLHIAPYRENIWDLSETIQEALLSFNLSVYLNRKHVFLNRLSRKWPRWIYELFYKPYVHITRSCSIFICYYMAGWCLRYPAFSLVAPCWILYRTISAERS